MKCQAEVRRLVRSGGFGNRSGSRQTNEYEFVRCSREATSIPVKMYPPRDAVQSMHSVTGRVCGQHGRQWLPRAAFGAGAE